MSNTYNKPKRNIKPPTRFCDEKFVKKDPYDRCLGGYKLVPYWKDENYHQPLRDFEEKISEERMILSIVGGGELNDQGYLEDDFVVSDDVIDGESSDYSESSDEEESSDEDEYSDYDDEEESSDEDEYSDEED